MGLDHAKEMAALLSEGCFYIYFADDVYEHDLRAIKDLQPGEYYYSTHPLKVNPDAARSRAYPS